MPPALGRPFSPSWAGHPPHMSQKDFELWQRWRNPSALSYSTLYFDVALGTSPHTADVPPEKTGDMWKQLTAFRADVLGETPESWTIIELRDNAGPGALGSLLTYAHLWTTDPPDDRPVRLILITNLLNAELLPLLTLHNIALALV